MSSLTNFGLYQLGWFAVVLGAANHRPWLGMGVALGFVGIHLLLAPGPLRQLGLIFAAGFVGLAVDTLQLLLGVFAYPSGMLWPWLAPPWDVILWMQFATILPFCLHWLSSRYLLCSLFGLVGGPAAFYAGERLGAIVFLAPRPLNFATLGVVWALVFPFLVLLSDKIVLAHGLGERYRTRRCNATDEQRFTEARG
jgi:hypothetical protein